VGVVEDVIGADKVIDEVIYKGLIAWRCHGVSCQ
jgi:hypothetical protein